VQEVYDVHLREAAAGRLPDQGEDRDLAVAGEEEEWTRIEGQP
jgi:hypothetical protein